MRREEIIELVTMVRTMGYQGYNYGWSVLCSLIVYSFARSSLLYWPFQVACLQAVVHSLLNQASKMVGKTSPTVFLLVNNGIERTEQGLLVHWDSRGVFGTECE